jgi:hypothetical protein
MSCSGINFVSKVVKMSYMFQNFKSGQIQAHLHRTMALQFFPLLRSKLGCNFILEELGSL